MIGAERILFTNPPWPDEQATTIHAKLMAHAVWLNEL